MFAKPTIRGLAAASLFVTLISMPAHADSAKALGKFGDWSSFTYSDKAGKVCYAATGPKRSINSPKGRGESYVTITHRPGDKSFDVVSITAGYSFKKDATAEIDIGGAKFDLYSQGETAWTRNDKAVVAAMQKGKSLVVHGTPAKGEPTADTFSLDGMPRALAEINKACGVK